MSRVGRRLPKTSLDPLPLFASAHAVVPAWRDHRPVCAFEGCYRAVFRRFATGAWEHRPAYPAAGSESPVPAPGAPEAGR